VNGVCALQGVGERIAHHLPHPLHEPDGWAVVEQSLYCYVSDGGIRNLDL
jgi:hypothetical protein